MLDRRKASIMRAVVRDYVRTGHPVGSQVLRDRHRLKVSAATIRNEMMALEELGFLTQPHTSAGRIPTDRGYRWFVDNWPESAWPMLPAKQRASIDDLLGSSYRGLDEALEETSHVLSDLAEATAVVVAPPSRKNRLRRMELLPRDDGKATLLLIADTGVVEQGLVDLPEGKDLAQLAQKLSETLDGVAFEDLASTLAKTPGDRTRAAVAKEIERIATASGSDDRIFRGGTSKILSPEKFPDISAAHEVVEALEHASVVASLADAAKESSSVLVFIGREVPVRQMRSCAVVFSVYGVGSERQGTLGVVGPTRMDYPHTISAVEAVARSLGELLNSLSV